MARRAVGMETSQLVVGSERGICLNGEFGERRWEFVSQDRVPAAQLQVGLRNSGRSDGDRYF